MTLQSRSLRSLEGWLLREVRHMQANVLEAVKRSAAIPSIPQVVSRFVEITQDTNFDYVQLVDVLSSDPGMTAEILRLANSPLFGVSRRISSLHQGMTLLGLRRIRSLVLARYVASTISDQATTVDLDYFWRRSLSTAVLAAKLAKHNLPEMQDETFVAGLLADIGVVVLSQAVEDAYEPVAEQYCPDGYDRIYLLEEQTCGCTHAEVTAWVLDMWKLPALIVEAVRFHHRYDGRRELDRAAAAIAGLVDAAGRIAGLLWAQGDAKDVAETCRQAFDLVKLPVSLLPDILDNVGKDIREVAEILRVRVPPVGIEQVARRIQEQLQAPVPEPAGL